MFSPTVQLRSGGYIVLNQTEALVAIDVNSGRATREHHIEDTALKTNMEAADEVARQLRLRDLAGLIVIDFIDMDEKRNNRSVERRMKEALKQDRARIQVGRISHFGLLEMSRQRIRTSVLESSTEKCPYCGGSGHVRSVSSLALQVLRALEDQLMKSATHSLIVRTRPDVALYVLNQKRAHLRALEERFAILITISSDATLAAPQTFAIDRGEQVHTIEAAKALAEQTEARVAPLEDEDDLEEAVAIEAEAEEAEGTEESVAPDAQPDDASGEGGGRRRRRRGRRGRRGGAGKSHAQQAQDGAPTEAGSEQPAQAFGDMSPDDLAEEAGETVVGDGSEPPHHDGDGRRRRRRGRRGGRRNRHDREHEAGSPAHQGDGFDSEQPPATGQEVTAARRPNRARAKRLRISMPHRHLPLRRPPQPNHRPPNRSRDDARQCASGHRSRRTMPKRRRRCSRRSLRPLPRSRSLPRSAKASRPTSHDGADGGRGALPAADETAAKFIGHDPGGQPASSFSGQGPMKSGWVDGDVENFIAQGGKSGVDRDFASRIYTTRLLGRDPTLVLHGGGNTSLKTQIDHLGQKLDVLRIKASGADMAAIGAAGLPAVKLDAIAAAACAR